MNIPISVDLSAQSSVDHEAQPAGSVGGGSAEMISDLLDTSVGRSVQPARRELRLAMKPDTAVRDGVDGGWWPWSTDPAAEFPALIMALSSWVGPARRMAYSLHDWDPAEDKMTVEGWVIRLEGSDVMRANTVTLTGPNPETAEPAGGSTEHT
jgi:hypothetical protein